MMYQNNQYFRQLIFVLIYASLVTYATRSFAQWSHLLNLENTVYDQLQSWGAIDAADDWRADRYREVLTPLYNIELDSAFFDWEKDRVKRKPLADLLEQLAQMEQIDAVFLNYVFEPLDTNNTGCLVGDDSLLYHQMKAFGSRLVFVKEKGTIANFDGNCPTAFGSPTTLNRNDVPRAGGLGIAKLDKDPKVRFFNVQSQKDTTPSWLTLFLNLHADGQEKNLLPKLPAQMELNYLIRNNRPIGRQPFLDGSAATDFLRNELDNGILANPKKRIVFIGAFTNLINKHELCFDCFPTPVDSNLGGIYINLNAYLNAISRSDIHRASNTIVFGINALLAFVGVFYFHWIKKKRNKTGIKPNAWLIGELLGCLFVFSFGLMSLFYMEYLKFPFVITSLIFIRNQTLYEWFSRIQFTMRR